MGMNSNIESGKISNFGDQGVLKLTLKFLILLLLSLWFAWLTHSFWIELKEEHTVSIELYCLQKGEWQLFFDKEGSLSEGNSIRLQHDGSGRQVFRFKFRGKGWGLLRFDPPDALGTRFQVDGMSVWRGWFFKTHQGSSKHFFPLRGITLTGEGDFKVVDYDPQFYINVEELEKEKTLWMLSAFDRFFVVLFCIFYFVVFGCFGGWIAGFFKNIVLYVSERVSVLFTASLVGGVSLLFALINGFPLLYSDTGVHIQSGFEWMVPTERTLVYGWFLRIGGVGLNAFFPLFLQGFWVGLVIVWYYRKTIAVTEFERSCVILISLVLVLCTSYGWFVSLWLPDLFCGVAALLILPLCDWRGRSLGTNILWVGMFMVCNLSHTSSMLISLILSFLVFCCGIVWCRFQKFPDSAFPLVLSIMSFPVLMTLNWMVGGRFELMDNSELFKSARFIETGQLQRKVVSDTKYHSFEIYKYVDRIPMDNDHFLWSDESVKHLIEKSVLKKELAVINRDIVFDFGELMRFFGYSMVQFKRLIFDSYGYSSDSYRGAYVEQVLQDKLVQYVPAMQASKQQQNRMSEFYWVFVNKTGYGISVFLILLGIGFVFIGKDWGVLGVLAFLPGVVVVNDLVCGFLSTFHSRYHLRVSWVTMMAAIFAVLFVLKKFSAGGWRIR
jgi:hypothetical protein